MYHGTSAPPKTKHGQHRAHTKTRAVGSRFSQHAVDVRGHVAAADGKMMMMMMVVKMAERSASPEPRGAAGRSGAEERDGAEEQSGAEELSGMEERSGTVEREGSGAGTGRARRAGRAERNGFTHPSRYPRLGFVALLSILDVHLGVLA